MKISDIVYLIIGNTGISSFAYDFCTCLLFTIYSIMLASPLYIVFTILKYKRKK